ncbi:MAG: hypothetical protein OXH75_01300, partial [Acidobacteria bacterium]|nr:hypothetical protein [Acidobacteriota bacterium]
MQHVRSRTAGTAALFLVVLLAAAPAPLVAQEEGTRNGEWPSYGGDLAHTRYSPLGQTAAGTFGPPRVRG